MSNKHKISVMISEDKLQEKIEEIGAKISADYEGKEIKLICILKGSIFFCCELAKRITVPVKIDFMQTSSYGSGTTSSGNIVIKKELDGVKVLGSGELTKKLTVKANAFTKSAQEKIETIGGKTEVI